MSAASSTAAACAQARTRGDPMRVLTFASLFFAALTAIAYIVTLSWVAPIPRDATSLVVGRDFLNFWMYGRAAWASDPSRFYDPRLYNEALQAFLGPHYPGQNWSYPPSIMLLAAPFGRLGYLPALACWMAVGLGSIIGVLRGQFADKGALAAILCSPAAIFCLISGQSAFLTAAVLLTVIAWLDRRPVLAGLLLGLLTVKPQLGLLFPIMLAASGRWRVFFVAAATALIIIVATTAIFGAQVWIDYVQKGLPVQNLVLADPDRIGTPYYPTIFMNMRGFGASYATAMTVQACFSLFAVGAVYFAYRWRSGTDPLLLTALLFACSICGIPYLLLYDTLPITCLAVMLLASGKCDALGQALTKLVFWLPLVQAALGQFHIPGAALIPVAFALYALSRLQPRADAAAAPSTDLLPLSRA
jgi:hypothetical protein